MTKDGEVSDLSSDEAWSDKGSLVSPDFVIRGEDASTEEGRGTVATQRPHPEVVELKRQHILDEGRVARVDGGAEVGVGGEGQSVSGVAGLEQFQETELPCCFLVLLVFFGVFLGFFLC